METVLLLSRGSHNSELWQNWQKNLHPWRTDSQFHHVIAWNVSCFGRLSMCVPVCVLFLEIRVKRVHTITREDTQPLTKTNIYNKTGDLDIF